MNFRATAILRKVSSLKLNVQLSSRARKESKTIGAAGYLFLVSARELMHKWQWPSIWRLLQRQHSVSEFGSIIGGRGKSIWLRSYKKKWGTWILSRSSRVSLFTLKDCNIKNVSSVCQRLLGLTISRFHSPVILTLAEKFWSDQDPSLTEEGSREAEASSQPGTPKSVSSLCLRSL